MNELKVLNKITDDFSEVIKKIQGAKDGRTISALESEAAGIIRSAYIFPGQMEQLLRKVLRDTRSTISDNRLAWIESLPEKKSIEATAPVEAETPDETKEELPALDEEDVVNEILDAAKVPAEESTSVQDQEVEAIAPAEVEALSEEAPVEVAAPVETEAPVEEVEAEEVKEEEPAPVEETEKATTTKTSKPKATKAVKDVSSTDTK